MCYAIALAAALLPQPAQSVILYATGDPNVNTAAPGGELAGSGWQYQGEFGGFLGTAIAPQFFITAKHVSGDGTSFNFAGTSYALAQAFHDPASDLTIWKISGNLPAFAPLYLTDDEVGRRLVVIGRGRDRGAEVYLNNTLRGWDWGGGSTQRWGENVVSGAFLYSNPSDPLLYANFDQDGVTNEAHLASGDSGGAVFISEGGTWKLAGINYAVDGVYREPGDTSQYTAALFDVRGYYEKVNGNYVQITGDNPVPTAFYATRISAKRDWIYSVIDPAGDRDGDGIPNLLEYAFHLNPDTPDVAGTPQFAVASGMATLTYRKVTTATDIGYTVQQSTDLIGWSTANAEEQRMSLVGNVETVKVSVPVGENPALFLRVAVTRP